MCKEPSKLNNKKTNKLIWKWTKDLNRHPTGEGIQVTTSIGKDSPAHMLLGKCKLKWQWHHSTQIRTPNIQSPKDPKHWRGCGEAGMLARSWWGCRAAQALRRTFWPFLTKLTNATPLTIRSSSHAPWRLLKGLDNLYPCENLHTMSTASLSNFGSNQDIFL